MDKNNFKLSIKTLKYLFFLSGLCVYLQASQHNAKKRRAHANYGSRIGKIPARVHQQKKEKNYFHSVEEESRMISVFVFVTLRY